METGEIIAALWTGLCLPLLIYAFKWLGSVINRNKVMQRWQVDEQIMRALRTAVENIGNQTADAIRANGVEWKQAVKKGFREQAKDEAYLLLDKIGRETFHELGDAGIDILIRRVVDNRTGAKKP